MKRKVINAVIMSMAVSIFAAAPAYAGWEQLSDGYHYSDESGTYAKDTWKKIGSYWYSFTDTGRMRQNEFFDDGGKTYYLNNDGVMVTQRTVVNNRVANFNKDGSFTGYGAHIDGFEDDLLEEAIIQTEKYWDQIEYAAALFNAERNRVGLPSLPLDRDVCMICTYRGAQMEKYEYFNHWVNGVSQSNMLMDYYYKTSGCDSYEILDHSEYSLVNKIPLKKEFSQTTREGVERLIASPGHYDAIVNTESPSFGVGIYSGTNDYMRYLTAIYRVR